MNADDRDDGIVNEALSKIQGLCEAAMERLGDDDVFHHGWLSAIRAIAEHGQKVIAETDEFKGTLAR